MGEVVAFARPKPARRRRATAGQRNRAHDSFVRRFATLVTSDLPPVFDGGPDAVTDLGFKLLGMTRDVALSPSQFDFVTAVGVALLAESAQQRLDTADEEADGDPAPAA
jgi:hypothetical protein